MKYYKTGMISLLFIPLLFIPYLNKEFQKRDLRVLKLNMVVPNYEDGRFFNFNILDKFREEATLIPIDVSDATLNEKFESLSKQDSNNFFTSNVPKNYQFGLKIKLHSTSTYADFIKLINLCEINSIERYALDTRHNEFYVFKIFNEAKEELKPSCGGVILVERRKTQTKLYRFIQSYIQILTTLEKTWGIFMFYVVLCVISFVKFKN